MSRTKGQKRRKDDDGGGFVATAPTAPPPGVSHLDHHLAALAVGKMREGKKLSRDETQSLRRFQKAQEEEQRWRYYRTIPAKHWQLMARRSAKTLQEQAGVYGIPFDGAVVDLERVVQAMHDCFKKYAYLFRGKRDAAQGDAGENATTTAERNKYIRLQQEMIQIEIDKARRELISRDELHQGLTSVAAELRKGIEILQARFGPLAAGVMSEKLARVEAKLADLLGPDDVSATAPPPPAPDAKPAEEAA